ncbi:MAG: HD domain-containing protein [bacterium]|nr:HD domain-containing protein [bacterium]
MNFIIDKNSGLSDGFCLISSCEKRTTAKGMPYLDLMLSDSSGEISAKIWEYDPDIHGVYDVGEIVKVRGLVSKYNGADQMKIERIRKSIPQDNVNPADFVKSSEFDGTVMFEQILDLVNNFSDADLKSIVSFMLNENKEKLIFIPAAFKLHHALRGGLLYHTLSIVRLAEGVCNIYPFINRELLLAGAILHDIAKISEFQLSPAGIVTGYTVEGNLVGHLAKGAIMVEKAAEITKIDETKKIMLQHMLLSHHGEPEFGAAVRPAFIEAEVLSELDLMDARMYEMADAVFETEIGSFSNKIWALDNRKLYNHGQNDKNRTVNILK